MDKTFSNRREKLEKELDTYGCTPNNLSLIVLTHGDNLLQYSFHCKILHLPGHTLGSIGILTESGDIIVGDTLANIKKSIAAPNAANFEMLAKSINRLKTMDIKTVYPGHDAPFESSNISNKYNG